MLAEILQGNGKRYNTFKIRTGVRINLISDRSYPDNSFTVAAASAFGSTHLRCISSHGSELILPEGTPHFSEHAVLYRHLYLNHYADPYSTDDIQLLELNGRVTRERTYWWGISWFEEGQGINAIVNFVQFIIGLFHLELTEDKKVKKLLTHLYSDVLTEVRYREGTDFPLSTALFRLLYTGSLGASALGTSDSLALIGLNEFRAAQSILRHGLTTLTILCKDIPAGTDGALQEALDGENTVGAPNGAIWSASSYASSRSRGQPRLLGEITRESYSRPTVAAAFSLSPLHRVYSGRLDLARMVLITHLLDAYYNVPISCTYGRESRTYFTKSRLSEPWLIQTDMRRALLRKMCDKIAHLTRLSRRGFENNLLMAVAGLADRPHGLIRLCHISDLHGLNIDEIVHSATEITSKDMERLIGELESPLLGVQVYLGPSLLEL